MASSGHGRGRGYERIVRDDERGMVADDVAHKLYFRRGDTESTVNRESLGVESAINSRAASTPESGICQPTRIDLTGT